MKAEIFHVAWKNQASETSFSGKTVEDLEAAMSALEEALDHVNEVNVARSAAMKVRDEKEAALKELLVLVAHGVRSDPSHGEDSALYRSMGFVPKSERSSGLTRRTKEGTGPSTGNEKAAA